MEVRRRLGIPYARAARFQPPDIVPFDRAGAYDTFGPAAPQVLDSPLASIVPGMGVGAHDEHNCLTLNVWAPADAHGLPVLVWFHGGSFVIGSSAQPVYDGARLAGEQQCVVVTANYRLGALGFLDARPLGGVANCGVRDAIAALQWVRAYAGELGGDPERIVAFGESAGAGVLLHVLCAPAAAGLVSGVIAQSGATFATLDTERAALVRDTLTKECGGADLGTIAIDELIAAQGRAMSTLLPQVGMMPFHPMVDGDVVPAAPPAALAAGAATGVPLIAGTTADEMRLFVAPGEVPRERLVARVARYLRVDETRAANAVDGYAYALGTDDGGTIWRALFGDQEMQVPCRAVLDAHAPHGPTYAYCFTWEGPEVGACHGIDIPFPFGNFGDGWDAFVGFDDDADVLSRRMRDGWGAFARTGDPGWPEYPHAMVFGRAPAVAPAHPLFARIPQTNAR